MAIANALQLHFETSRRRANRSGLLFMEAKICYRVVPTSFWFKFLLRALFRKLCTLIKRHAQLNGYFRFNISELVQLTFKYGDI